MTAPLDVSKLPTELRTELERRFRMRAEAKEAKGFLAELHPAQRRFIDDPCKRKALLCSRRAGKSYVILAWLIQGALDDIGGTSVYVAGSKGIARRNLGEAIDVFKERWPNLQLTLSEQDGQLMLRVGATRHVIWLAGAKDKASIGKFRGAKYKRVAVDEAQEYGSFLIELLRDVIEPALIDKAGELVIAGTPSPIPAGLFYEATTGDGASPKWDTHSWTLFENPYLKDPQGEVNQFCRQYGLTKDSPTYRREWMGLWVRDVGALVYPFSYILNGAVKEDVPDDLSYVLGVDIGFSDASAFVVAGISPNAPSIWVVEAHKREGMTPSAVAAQVEQYIHRYGRGLRVVVDSGGIGKGYAEEMRERYGIGCEPAEKTKKRAYQEIVAGELRNGTIKILGNNTCRDLLDEISVLQWGPGYKEQDDRFEDHCADAFLYAVRASHNWYRSEYEPPAIGTEKWHAAQAAKTREMILERVQRRNKGRGWRLPPEKR